MDIFESIAERFLVNYAGANVTPEAVAAFVAKCRVMAEAAVAKTPTKWDDKALAALEGAVQGGDALKAVEGLVLSLAAAAASGNAVASDVIAVIKKNLGV
jgi:hypothetical protein